MPLVKDVLKTSIETNLKNKLLLDPKVKESLRKKLDGSILNGTKTGSSTLHSAYQAVKIKTELILGLDYDAGGAAAKSAEELIRRVTSNEMANALSEAIVDWMAEQIVPAIAASVANNVDTFVRSATIITPAGQITAGTSPAGPTTGATTTPSSPALIS
jgi:hypothetical protein